MSNEQGKENSESFKGVREMRLTARIGEGMSAKDLEIFQLQIAGEVAHAAYDKLHEDYQNLQDALQKKEQECVALTKEFGRVEDSLRTGLDVARASNTDTMHQLSLARDELDELIKKHDNEVEKNRSLRASLIDVITAFFDSPVKKQTKTEAFKLLKILRTLLKPK